MKPVAGPAVVAGAVVVLAGLWLVGAAHAVLLSPGLVMEAPEAAGAAEAEAGRL